MASFPANQPPIKKPAPLFPTGCRRSLRPHSCRAPPLEPCSLSRPFHSQPKLVLLSRGFPIAGPPVPFPHPIARPRSARGARAATAPRISACPAQVASGDPITSPRAIRIYPLVRFHQQSMAARPSISLPPAAAGPPGNGSAHSLFISRIVF
jgi:hypothetical protein